MKEWMKRLFTAAVCIALVVSFVRIQNLKDELERETGYLQHRVQSLESQINSIYREVDEMLETEASLITFEEWKITSMDVEGETANIKVTITPKEYQEGVTEAVLQVGNQECPMTMKDGSFRAEVETALFDNCQIESMVMRDGSQVRTEYLGWSIHPRYDMLPDVSAHLNGKWSFGPRGKDYCTAACDGTVQINIDSKGEMAEIQSVHLLEVLDGEVQERTEIPADENGMYTAECKKNYELPFGARFELVAEVVDQYGLVYRCIAERWQSDKDGQLIDDDMNWIGRSAAVYNQDGKLLFMD